MLFLKDEHCKTREVWEKLCFDNWPPWEIGNLTIKKIWPKKIWQSRHTKGIALHPTPFGQILHEFYATGTCLPRLQKKLHIWFGTSRGQGFGLGYITRSLRNWKLFELQASLAESSAKSVQCEPSQSCAPTFTLIVLYKLGCSVAVIFLVFHSPGRVAVPKNYTKRATANNFQHSRCSYIWSLDGNQIFCRPNTNRVFVN